MKKRLFLPMVVIIAVMLACSSADLGLQITTTVEESKLPAASDTAMKAGPQAGDTATETMVDIPSATVTLTPSETLIPSETPIPSETMIPSSTIPPTLPPSDPKSVLSPTPDWIEHFDNPNNWNPYVTGTGKAEIIDGKFLYMKFPDWSGAEWLLTYPMGKNFYLEVMAQTPLHCEGTDRYGLVFRAPDTKSGYFFTVACDGTFRFYVWDGNHRKDLIKWRSEPAINAGPSQVNRLGVKAEGEVMALFINGYPVGEVEDDTYLNAGRFGFVIASAKTPNFIVAFDELYYWNIR